MDLEAEVQEEEIQVEKEGVIQKLYSSPWAISIILTYLSMLLIWIYYYRSIPYLPFGLSLASLLIISFAYTVLDLPATPLIERDSSWVMSVVWVFTIVLISGGGIFTILTEPFSTWVLFLIFFLGPVTLLRLSGRLTLNNIGIRKGNNFLIGLMILLSVGIYGPTIIYSLSSVSLDILDLTNLTITATLLPAVVEEIVFRGIIQERIATQFRSHISGIMITGLFFGLGHIWTNSSNYNNDLIAGFLVCFFAQFLAGVVYGLVYHFTKSIIATMVMHYMHNANVWIMTSSVTQSSTTQIAPVQFFIYMVVVVIIILLILRKSSTSNNGE